MCALFSFGGDGGEDCGRWDADEVLLGEFR